MPEMFRQFEHRAGDAAFERKEATGCNHRVCFAKASSEKRDQQFVELWMFFCKGLERDAAKAAQRGVTHRDHRRRARQSVDQRKLADDVASADEGKDALVTGVRNHRDLKEPVIDAIAVVAGTTGQEQSFASDEPYQLGAGKQLSRKTSRQPRQQVHIFRLKGRGSVRWVIDWIAMHGPNLH